MKDKLYKIIEGLVKFPYPQICRHSVACDLLSLLEEQGEQIDDLARAIVTCNDDEALAILEHRRGV